MSGRVARIESWLLRLPYAPGARTRPDETVELVGVFAETSDGVRGMGFSYSLCGGGAAIRSLLDECVSPRVLGRSLADRAVFADEIRWDLRRLGPGMPALALAPVDIALWDAAARSSGTPLHRMLGARRDRVPLFASGRYSPALAVEQLVENALADVARGFTAVKLRVGGRPVEADLARVRAVRDALGPGVRLLVDAAELLTLDEARRLGAGLAELDVTCLEEPLPSEDLAGYRALQAALPYAVALGEHLTSRRQFLDVLEAQAADVLNPDVAIVGGITEFLRVAEVAAAAGRTISPHLVCDLHVPLAAAVPNLRDVEEFPFTESLWREPVEIRDGFALVPDRPGHGLDFDPAAFDYHRVA